MGINPVKWKLYAFAVGAFFAGITGVFFAAWQSFVSPESFTLWESIIILTMVIMGGMGNLIGCIIAAIVLVLLPEFLRRFGEVRMLIFGVAMTGIVIFQQLKFGIKIKSFETNKKKVSFKVLPLVLQRKVGRNRRCIAG